MDYTYISLCRTLWFILSVYNGFYLLPPTTHSVPPQLAPLGSHQSVLCDCDSVPVSQIGSFVSYFRFHI